MRLPRNGKIPESQQVIHVGILLLGERLWVLTHVITCPCFCHLHSSSQIRQLVLSDEHSVWKCSWRLECSLIVAEPTSTGDTGHMP